MARRLLVAPLLACLQALSKRVAELGAAAAGGGAEQLRSALQAFAAEREWQQFHTPRNLLLALTGEVGELGASRRAAITRDLGEVGKEARHIVEHGGTRRVPRHEHALPGREPGIDLGADRLDAPMEPRDLLLALRPKQIIIPSMGIPSCELGVRKIG